MKRRQAVLDYIRNNLDSNVPEDVDMEAMIEIVVNEFNIDSLEAEELVNIAVRDM